MRVRETLIAFLLSTGWAAAQSSATGPAPAPVVDHHQHLVSSLVSRLWSLPEPVPPIA